MNYTCDITFRVFFLKSIQPESGYESANFYTFCTSNQQCVAGHSIYHILVIRTKISAKITKTSFGKLLFQKLARERAFSNNFSLHARGNF